MDTKGKKLTFFPPVVMGILNLTPDSFYDGGFYDMPAKILAHAEKMLREGASILDLGAASSRPGAMKISADEELERLLPALKMIRKEFPGVWISVDTYNAKTVSQSVAEGADIINDISAGSMDDSLLDTVAKLGVPYVLMHMQGNPLTMLKEPLYADVVKEVDDFFEEKIKALEEKGIRDIILDPGFGFGKTPVHNHTLLHHLDVYKRHGKHVLAGLSRKSMITRILECDPADALNGTTVLNTIALLKGADILRVHDVKEAMEAVKLVFVDR